jgi:hypothetical protein
MTQPVILSEQNDGQVIRVRMPDGNVYRLEHPGNRVKLQWQKEFYNMTTGVDQERFLDLCFEHVVHPDGHANKPGIDTVKPAHLEVWQRLLHRFLDGGINLDLAKGETGAKSGGNAGGGKGANPAQ